MRPLSGVSGWNRLVWRALRFFRCQKPKSTSHTTFPGVFNCTCIPDWSHAAQNDFYGCLRDLSVCSFWLMCLVFWNVEHSPWQDDLRWQQVGDAWAEATEHFDMQSMPIFAEFLEEVVKENGGSGAVLPSSEFGTVEATVWDSMR